MPKAGGAKPPTADDEMVMKLQVPRTAGVFADDAKFLVTDTHVLITFLQVFDIDRAEKTLMGQVAAQVYLPVEDARRFHAELGKALEQKGEAGK